MRFSISLLCLLSLFASAASAQSWRYIRPMLQPRGEHRSVELRDGRILIIGGQDGSLALTECEIYNPKTDRWTVAGSLNVPRFRAEAFLLPDGRVFIAGGLSKVGISPGTTTTATCEIYDPFTDSWRLTASMSAAREALQACVIHGDSILLVGGLDGNTGAYLKSADVFDFRTETMLRLPDMPQQTAGTSAIYDSSRQTIYVPGGAIEGGGGPLLTTNQTFDLRARRWSLAAALPEAQCNHYNSCWNRSTDEAVVVAGAVDSHGVTLTDKVITFDPRLGVWTQRTTIDLRRDATVSIIGDSLLITGGHDTKGNCLGNVWWIGATTYAATPAPALLDRITNHAVVVPSTNLEVDSCHPSRRVYVFGGRIDGTFTNDCEVLEIAAPRTISLPSISLKVGPCTFVDTAITVANPACDTLFLSTRFSSSTLLWVDTSLSIAPGDEGVLRFRGSGFTASGNSELSLQLRQGGRSWDTSITITLNYVDGGRTSVRALIQDKIGVRVGDTISMPLYLFTPLTTGDDLFLTFAYNTDLLQMLEPSFVNTSMSAGALFDLKERRNMATLEFPGSVSFSASLPFAILRFRVMLTDTMSSNLTLQSLSLGSGAPTDCIALANPSALVSTSLQCEERPIYELLRDDPIGPLRVSESEGSIQVSISSGAICDIRMYDELGRLIEDRQLPATAATTAVTLPVTHTGCYTILISRNGSRKVSRIAVTR